MKKIIFATGNKEKMKEIDEEIERLSQELLVLSEEYFLRE